MRGLSPREAVVGLGVLWPAVTSATTLPSSIADYAWTPPGVTSWVTGRLTASNRTLLLDGQPYLMRGVTYSPTPIGRDLNSPDTCATRDHLARPLPPHLGAPCALPLLIATCRPSALRRDKGVGDFFNPAMEPVWSRELPVMRAMGINTVRVYTLTNSPDHTAFLDMAYALNLTVLAGFPLFRESMRLRIETPVGAADLNLPDIKDLIRSTVNANRHPAIGMWLVGNEANLGENGFVCEVEQYCDFWDDVEALYDVLNELCEVVEQEGYLCTSPLADVALTNKYAPTPLAINDFNAHVRVLEARCDHFHLWMVSLNSGQNAKCYTSKRLGEIRKT